MEESTAQRAPSPVEHHDPLLAKVLETATFECDWPTLRHHLYLALLAAVPVFQQLGEPVANIPVPSFLLSPTASRDAEASRQAGIDSGRSTPLSDGQGEPADESLRPSTPGGLVIPPFPPLDPKRRRSTVTVITANADSRINGTPNMSRGNPFEDEYDDEVIIGGRKLAGWMDEDEAKKETDRVAQKLEELTFPPFTLQRLTELVCSPTKLHKSLGKFLRAVDKMLVVTTAHAAPSYTYAPPPNQLSMEDFGSPHAAPASLDVDSTVPPGSMTPMFSPIPFLPADVEPHEHMVDTVRPPSDEALMSPLMLSGSSSVFPQSGDRSPTPEPEQAERPAEETETSPSTDLAPSSDPGNQPYLGRVDELDSGPITTNGHHDDEGVGETGNMMPHGMSERPVALSSTTVIDEVEREIAPLPSRPEPSP